MFRPMLPFGEECVLVPHDERHYSFGRQDDRALEVQEGTHGQNEIQPMKNILDGRACCCASSIMEFG